MRLLVLLATAVTAEASDLPALPPQFRAGLVGTRGRATSASLVAPPQLDVAGGASVSQPESKWDGSTVALDALVWRGALTAWGRVALIAAAVLPLTSLHYKRTIVSSAATLVPVSAKLWAVLVELGRKWC